MNVNDRVVEDFRFTAYFEMLACNGFLINNQKEEVKILEYNYLRHHFSDKFMTLTILPTLLCNFDCPYCFEKVKDLSWNDERLERMKLFAKKNFRNKTNINISIFGGEPLLQWKRLKVFLEYVTALKEEYGFDLMLTGATNAYYMTQDVIDDLFDRFCCRSMQFSIDGSRESHNSTRKLKNGNGTYDTVLHHLKLTLQKIKGTGKRIGLRVNLLNNSTEDARKLLEEFDAEEKERIMLYFRPVFDSDIYSVKNCNRENLEDFYKLAKVMGYTFIDSYSEKIYYCESDSGLNTFEINPNLTLWKCMSDSEHAPAELGYISETGDIVYSMDKLQKWSQKNPFSDKNCAECTYLPFCYGGCPLEYSKYHVRSCFYEKNFDLVELLTHTW